VVAMARRNVHRRRRKQRRATGNRRANQRAEVLQDELEKGISRRVERRRQGEGVEGESSRSARREETLRRGGSHLAWPASRPSSASSMSQRRWSGRRGRTEHRPGGGGGREGFPAQLRGGGGLTGEGWWLVLGLGGAPAREIAAGSPGSPGTSWELITNQ
jgi:hypothetical protein